MRLIPYVRKSRVPARTWPDDASRLFEEFFNDFPMFPAFQREREWSPSVDVLEKEGKLILRAELPGIDEKDIDLKIEGNVLTLKGEKKLEKEDEKNNYHRMETFYGSFTRSFTLPETVELDKVSADYKNGILTITIPHKPEVRPREIAVTVH